MSLSPSAHLGAWPLCGLNKVGDCLVPGGDDFPSFSQSGCILYVDRILDYLPAADRAALAWVLRLFALTPAFAVRALLRLLEADPPLPAGLGAHLRNLRLGLRGLVLSLYYSAEEPLRLLGYQPRAVAGEEGASQN